MRLLQQPVDSSTDFKRAHVNASSYRIVFLGILEIVPSIMNLGDIISFNQFEGYSACTVTSKLKLYCHQNIFPAVRDLSGSHQE